MTMTVFIKNRKNLVITTCLFAFFSFSCRPKKDSKNDSNKGGDYVNFEAFDWTVVATQSTLDAINVIENGYIEFNGSPKQASEIITPSFTNLRTSVLVLGVTNASPDGMVAIITKKTNFEGNLRLHYLPGTPIIAFRKMKIRTNQVLQQDASAEGRKLSGGFEFLEFEDLQLSGSMTSEHAIDIMLAWDWGDNVEPKQIAKAIARCALKLGCEELIERLPAVDTDTKTKSSITTTLTLSGSVAMNIVDYSKDLVTFKLKPILIGPIVLVPELTATLGINIQLGAGFEASASMTSTLNSELIVKNNELQEASAPEITQTAEFSSNLETGLEAFPQGGLEISLLGTLNLRAFKIAGPYIGLGPGATSEFDLGNVPCGNNSIGASYLLGFAVDTNFDGEDDIDYPLDGLIPAFEEAFECS